MPPQALAAVATLLSIAQHGNRIDMQLDRGAAELTWVTPSTFRFRRTLEGPLPALKRGDQPIVPVTVDDLPGAFRLHSGVLDITIQKRGALLSVRRPNGAPLMADLSEPRALGAGVVWERQSLTGVRFYGLGPRTDSTFDVRGKSVQAEVPFLICTAGYGEFHPGTGLYRFDFTTTDRYQIRAPEVDYYFYYGPTVKQIFEEHKDLGGGTASWTVAPDRFGSWTTLRAALLRLVHGAMSGRLAPALSLRPYENTTPELVQRARQIGSLVDDVSPGPLGLSGLRKQLETFYTTYAAEARDKGFPLWHPLPFQFPEDPECALHTDEFMLGDEMLIAPIYQPGNQRSVYLPQGIWTNLETNEVSQGRRTIRVETAALPVFARNGTIVPLDSPGGLALHYFPTLGAEFFVLEGEEEGWTQIHAAPALDIMRLQIEARKTHDYQWVVHHVEKPSEVSFAGTKYQQAASSTTMRDRTWFYDAAQKNLEIRVRVQAAEDCIINITF